MTTITTRQAAYIEDLRSNLTPVDPATIAANIQYVLDYAVRRAHQMTRRAIRIDLRKNGPIQLEELKARTQEILNVRLQQTDVRALMENRITEWATDSERDYTQTRSAPTSKKSTARKPPALLTSSPPLWGSWLATPTHCPQRYCWSASPNKISFSNPPHTHERTTPCDDADF